MVLLILTTLCAGLFAGASLYINLVEHPARVSCGTEFALREFAPSYARAAVMQASLALVGLAAGVAAWWLARDPWVLAAAVLLGAVVPYTLLVMMPTNQHILHPALDATPPEKLRLLARWGRLHAVRTVLSLSAFVILVARS
ncbi:MAG: DUF1772 domain-containing protein [Gammaproteobacteria bacterium]|nr:DUF1772 domain-containing protein [Gammaproteobacteria bacterium]